MTDVQSTDNSDAEGAGLTYSLTTVWGGGVDNSLFTLNTNTGLLTFTSAPDFENPADGNSDNIYQVQVTVTDSGGLTDRQDINVRVTDVAESIGLVGHWMFDDDNGDTQANDSSGNGNHGTIKGPTFIAGKNGGALSFDGVDDYVDLGRLNVNGTGLTIAAWINADSFVGFDQDGRIVSKATGIQQQDHFWMLSTIRQGSETVLRFRLKTGGITDTLIAGSGNLSVGQWHHVAATYDGALMRLYLDGVEVGSLAKTGTVDVNAAAPAWIGRNPGNYGPFDGRIDDARLYDHGLSQHEIQYLIGGINNPPTITSNGSGVAAVVNAAENQTAVTDVQSSDDGDAEGTGLTYSLTTVAGGGADNGLFTLNAASGVLTFSSAPDFENPADGNSDNIYQVQVTVTDSGGLTDRQDITITVTDVGENSAPTISSDGGGATASVNAAENQTAMTNVNSSDDSDAEGAG